MRIPSRFSVFSVGAFFLFAAAPLALAGGDPARPAPSPKPDVQKKVWTTDDVERLNPAFGELAGAQPKAVPAAPSTAAAARAATPAAPARVAAAASLPSEKDPAWYGQRLADLQAELAAIEDRSNQLRNFRNTGTTAGTGLVLNAPCTGISTDNLIANLEAQRHQILVQIDALGDLARANGLPAGILVEGRGLVLSAPARPTPEEQRAQLAQSIENAQAELGDIEATLAGMQSQAASVNATLQKPTPGFGGNMTTDLLDRLGNRAAALQAQIGSASDAARALGVAPGSLP